MFHNYKKQIIYRYAISNLSFERGSISIIWITFLPRHIMFRFVWIIDRRTDYNIYKNWRWLKFYLETTIRQSLPIFDEISPLFQCLASSPIFPYLFLCRFACFSRSESRPTPSVPMKLRENGGFFSKISHNQPVPIIDR